MKKVIIFSFLILFSIPLFSYAENKGNKSIIVLDGVEMEWDGYRVKESESDLDPYSTLFDDIEEGRFFTVKYENENEVYAINKGNIGEGEVFHIHSPNPGPTIYIVAGVHGDEKAAWYAGIMLKRASIKCGDLYILSPANVLGAERRNRFFYASQDLNRSFPGDKDGNEAEKMAYSIMRDIERVNPDFVFDLHEAIVYTEGRDFLGSSYIFTDLTLMDDLFFSLLWASEDGEICTSPFAYNGPSPKGSINRVVSEELRIPCITVESFRGFDIRRRVYDQLDSVHFVLKYYGMV